MENKRLKARERYRRRKKISKKQAEAKAAAKAEKKAAAEVKAAEVKAAEDEATAAAEAAVFDDDVIISPWNKPQAKKPVRTPTKKLSPEEEAAYISKTKFVFAAFNGDSDDNDDW